jgi:hypothetical protein
MTASCKLTFDERVPYSFDHLDYLVEGYAEWIEALGRVVARRNELFGTLY